MHSNPESLLVILALASTVSALGPVIELPPNYNRSAPWKHLSKLGLESLKETDCLRTCVADEASRVCLYTLILEHYAAMGTACGNCSQGVLEDCFRSQCIPVDGIERGVMSINRKIPGPPIHVCKNDLMLVRVSNRMTGTSSTIHWHGILHHHSQWMDGVPRTTQCPIGAGEVFTYIFPVEEFGTLFYHSHTGEQKMNGQYGAFIVREPRCDEPWSEDIYDFDLPEHTILLSDWMHDYAEMFLPGLPTAQPGNRPTTLLINGLGRFSNSSVTSHPLATFHVERNKRYRMRIINAATMQCPLQIQIEDHAMTVITTDGRYIEPVVVDTVVSYSGERFDIVIDTADAPLGKNAFWIHIRGLGICDFEYKLDQYGVLSYGTDISDLGIIPEGSPPTISNPLPINTLLNHPNTTCGASPTSLCITDLRAIELNAKEDILTVEPNVRLFIPIGAHVFENLDNFHREGNYQRYANPKGNAIQSTVMDNISFKFLPTPTLFTRDRDPGFCNVNNLPKACLTGSDNSTTPYCECTHYVTIKHNDIVELTMIDSYSEFRGVNHAMHIHGYVFYVTHIGQDLTKPNGYTVDEVREILNQKSRSDEIPEFTPAIKDTVLVPSRGFTTIRFKADNPGDWLLHCHFDLHAIIGMVMGFRVEGKIAQQPPGYPKCGDFRLF